MVLLLSKGNYTPAFVGDVSLRLLGYDNTRLFVTLILSLFRKVCLLSKLFLLFFKGNYTSVDVDAVAKSPPV